MTKLSCIVLVSPLLGDAFFFIVVSQGLVIYRPPQRRGAQSPRASPDVWQRRLFRFHCLFIRNWRAGECRNAVAYLSLSPRVSAEENTADCQSISLHDLIHTIRAIASKNLEAKYLLFFYLNIYLR